MQIMISRCKLFEEKIETAAQKKLEIIRAFAENPGGGNASRIIDVAGPITTGFINLASGITLAMAVVTFGAASFAGACVVGVTLAIKTADKKIKQNNANVVLTAVEKGNVSYYLNCIVKDVAKELSRIFELQLFELQNDKQVGILAECAVDLMLDLNKNDSFDRNTLIKKVLQDGKIKEKNLLTRKDMKWLAPDVFRKPGLRRVIVEKDGADIKYFVKSSGGSKNKKDVCDTITYGYRGQFLEMKEFPTQEKENENDKEETDKRDDLREDFCKECFSNDENCTSRRYFVESDIDSKYIEPQDEPYRYDAMHILIQCPEILVDFSQLRTSPKPSLANFLKKKLCLSDNLLVHPVYRPHSPAKVPNLKNSDLTGSDFSHSDFSHSCLEKCDFTKCVMLFAELAGAKMSGSTFCETFISHSNLIEVEADQCEWTKTSVLYSRAEHARLDSVVPTIGCNCFTGTSISHTITVQKPEINCNESKYINKTCFETLK